ncbi:4'-phosphopantetheinyl transferase family protein [Crateriforma conspicua]|nr:4'-phosphopantetheinyl transferase superfamily protein [Crateriforma conspicua]
MPDAIATATSTTAQIQLWHAPSSAQQPGRIETQCQRWMPVAEVQAAQRFRRPTTRHQHIIGRGMSRRLLGGDGVDPHAIEFHWLPHGKPEVRRPDEAKQAFNVAHTDGLVVCGIADTDDILLGVDVEPLDRKTDAKLAERYFSKPEIEHLSRCRDRLQRQQTFLRIWTLKESFIKAIGTGLHTPLGHFAFEKIDDDQPVLRVLQPGLDQGRYWTFRCFSPRPGYIASVAIGATVDTLRCNYLLQKLETLCIDPGDPDLP